MKPAIVILLLLASATAGLADEDAASYFCDRGRKALSEKKIDEAEKLFIKALSEHDCFVPALLGLAEVAHAKDDKNVAIGYLERCLEAEGSAGLSDECKKAIVKAKELLKDLDRPRLEYQALLADYFSRLLKLARKSIKSDPELARRAVERILRLKPDHEEAQKLREQAQATLPASEAVGGGTAIRLFNGKNKKNWSGAGDAWKVSDGVLSGTVGNACRWINHERRISGNYALSAEMRIREDRGEGPSAGIVFGVKDNFDRYMFEIHKTFFILFVNEESRKPRKIARVNFSLLWDDFDRRSWNKIRIEVKNSTVKILVNRTKIFEHEAEAGEFDGFPGLTVQMGTAEWRNVVFEQ